MTSKFSPGEIRRQLFGQEQRRICAAKKRFLDENSAAKYLPGIAKNKGAKPLRPYKCNWCGFWHVTTAAAK